MKLLKEKCIKKDIAHINKMNNTLEITIAINKNRNNKPNSSINLAEADSIRMIIMVKKNTEMNMPKENMNQNNCLLKIINRSQEKVGFRRKDTMMMVQAPEQ